MTDVPCPCGSGATYATCCGLYHAGAPAPTAEALMRSRYSAFARRILPYLIRTCHPSIQSKQKPKDILATFDMGWKGLEIVATHLGGPADQTGVVRFRATHADGVMEEPSRFVRVSGEWRYLDGRGVIPG